MLPGHLRGRGHRNVGQKAWGQVLSWRAHPSSGSRQSGHGALTCLCGASALLFLGVQVLHLLGQGHSPQGVGSGLLRGQGEQMLSLEAFFREIVFQADRFWLG